MTKEIGKEVKQGTSVEVKEKSCWSIKKGEPSFFSCRSYANNGNTHTHTGTMMDDKEVFGTFSTGIRFGCDKAHLTYSILSFYVSS